MGAGFIGRDLAVLRRLQRAGRVTMGPGTYGVPEFFTNRYDPTSLHVGNYSSVAAVVMLGGGHPADRVTTYPHRVNMGMEGAGEDGFPTRSKDTVIGSDVYIGWRAVLLSGITIGDGAIVGAQALVTKDVPPYAIVGGNPAKLIRYRFPEEQRQALLEIRWWDWPEQEFGPPCRSWPATTSMSSSSTPAAVHRGAAAGGLSRLPPQARLRQ